MSTNSTVIGLNKKSLPLMDMDAELKKFEEEERKRLGLLVMGYLLITAVLFGFAKRRIWREVH